MMDNMRSDAYHEIKYKIIHFDYIPGQKKYLKKNHFSRTRIRENPCQRSDHPN